jgi:hypothetical protein
MHKLRSTARRWNGVITLALAVLLTTGCTAGKDSSVIGTFRMGERVQAGPLEYSVTEANWRAVLSETGPRPTNRYLFLKVSIRNTGNAPVAVPGFTLLGPEDAEYSEVTEGMRDVPNWLGLFRTVQPSETQQGWVVFDAPLGAYRLAVSDGGEIGSEKYAHINIPVQLD